MSEAELIGPEYCAILLAAGYSRRFGSDKLMHPLEDGTQMGVKSAQALQAVFRHVVAVVNPQAATLSRLYKDMGLDVITNPFARQGMGLSLASGVAHTPGRKGWVIALADMPFIRPESIRQVADALLEGALLAAPIYEGKRGHPVGFAGRFEAELLALHEDKGAGGIVQRYQRHLSLPEVDDPGVLRDIDTPF
ncbi:MAG: nucleotidyltransferase family protein [Thiolinea sp.]